MLRISPTDQQTLEGLVQGLQRIVDVPMALSPGDPDKTRVKEVQALAGLLTRTDLSREGDRALQMLEQVKLLIDGIANVGTRVSMKSAARLVDQAVTVLRKYTASEGTV